MLHLVLCWKHTLTRALDTNGQDQTTLKTPRFKHHKNDEKTHRFGVRYSLIKLNVRWYMLISINAILILFHNNCLLMLLELHSQITFYDYSHDSIQVGYRFIQLQCNIEYNCNGIQYDFTQFYIQNIPAFTSAGPSGSTYLAYARMYRR